MKTKKATPKTPKKISTENTVKDNNAEYTHEVIKNMGKEGWPFLYPVYSLVLVAIKRRNNIGLN